MIRTLALAAAAACMSSAPAAGQVATLYFAAEYTVNHMLLDPRLRSHLSLGYYEAGHMLYTQLKSLEKAKGELAKFYAASAS